MDAFSGQLRKLGFCLGILACAGASVGSALTPDAWAQNFDFDFTGATSFDRAGSTGLWNTVAGQLQTGVVVASNPAKRLDFGDGSDGAFSDGPAQSGITISGNSISFNTNVKATYQFTSFNLSSGKTITATGSSPLQIFVLGDAAVSGTLSANGSTGTPNQIAAGYPSGGVGGAGGGSGGQGGSPADGAGSTTGTAGAPASPPTRDSGDPGVNVATALIQGGGGACHSAGTSVATAGSNNGASAGGCASSVATVAATLDASLLGGSGGGGGGARVTTNTSSGSGGGGGGGAIRLAVLGRLTLGGTLEAKGGNGGATEAGATATTCGGGGGGGSGGAVWIQTLTSGGLSGSGSVSVAGGNGGGSVVTCNGSDFPGGNGGSGIYRTDTPTGTQPWSTSPAATAQNSSVAVLAAQTYTVLSKGLDRRSSLFSADASQWATPTETFRTSGTYCGSAGTTTVVYEGSDDNVTWSSSVAKALVATQLAHYRYLRFRVTFDTTAGTPPCVSQIAIPLDLANLPLRGGFFFCASQKNLSGGLGTDWLASLINLMIVMVGPVVLFIGLRTNSRSYGSSAESERRIQSSALTS